MNRYNVMRPGWRENKRRMNDDHESRIECFLRLVTWSLRGEKRTREGDGGKVKKFMSAVNWKDLDRKSAN